MLIEDEHYSSVLTRGTRSGRAAPHGATTAGLYGKHTDRSEKDVLKIESGQATQLLENSVCFALCRPGGYCGAAAPVPIPNTAVKRPSANGTSS